MIGIMGSEVLFIEAVKVEALDKTDAVAVFSRRISWHTFMQRSELGCFSALCDMKSLKGELCQCSFAPLKLCWTRDALLQTDI